MNVLIVYCHPEPFSFNGSLRDIAVTTFETEGNRVEVSDLYAENFDPVENQSITETESLPKGLNHYQSNAMPIKLIHYQMI